MKGKPGIILSSAKAFLISDNAHTTSVMVLVLKKIYVVVVAVTVFSNNAISDVTVT